MHVLICINMLVSIYIHLLTKVAVLNINILLNRLIYNVMPGGDKSYEE